MSTTPVKPWKGFLDDGHSEGVWQSSEGAWQSVRAPHPAGHTHFCDRALSRRAFVQTAAGVTGVVVGLGNANGMGTATMNGTSSRLAFGADCRFMKGRYIGDDGAQHSGTFGFI